MFPPLRELEIITYRAPLALHFTDSVTGRAVTDGLSIVAWRYDPAQPQVVRRFDQAEKSLNSGIYGFRSLPGLERYQQGVTVAPESFSYVVQIEDRLNRYLPQTQRFDLPLTNPAVQEIRLFSSSMRPTPPGFATVRGQLLRTNPDGALPQIRVIEPARWAQVTVALSPDPADRYNGLADVRGVFVVFIPYPIISSATLLNEAEWNGALSVNHHPTAINDDLANLRQALPNLDETQTAPFQTTLTSQTGATVFGDVTVVDVEAQIFTVIGPTNETSLDITVQFGRPTVVRTLIDSDPAHTLSELLILS